MEFCKAKCVGCERGGGLLQIRRRVLRDAAGRFRANKVSSILGQQYKCPRRRTHPVQIRCASSSSKVADLETTDDVGVFDELSAGSARKYIMISGKGGVGKTSLATSLAVKFAEAGHTTLIVSTDPAHSLSDSLNQDVSGGVPVPVEGTVLPLWGMEIDPDKAKQDIRGFADSKDGKKMTDFMEGIGFGLDELADLKLGELLDSPPPGLDEAVALAKVVEFVTSEDYAKFSRIVFDTAPTGHTLRLLNLPDFVDSSLTKIIKLRKKLKAATGAIQALFGNDSEGQEDAIDKLEMLQNRIDLVKLLFQNEKTTEFIIATIPTVLGINESARLLTSLRKQKVPCKRIVVNQLLDSGSPDTYLRLKVKDQQRSLQLIEDSPVLSTLKQIQAPLLDLEVRGVPALMYFAHIVWTDVFDEMNSSGDRKYVMVGGKGGVGKTSCSAALAVKYAEAGEPTLIVSTDPAHSLSDSLDQDVSGGVPVPVEGTSLPLYGMEIDIQQARQEMKDAMTGDEGLGLDKILGDVGLGGFSEQLQDLNLGELLDNPPPGTDEAVAISKVIQFLKQPQYSKFKRIVFDTAPTGHTLRLLTLPDFLERTIGKIVQLRAKIQKAADMVKGVFGGGGKADTESVVKKLETLKANMEEARALFRNQDLTEFVIVAIPTIMAANESERLASALKTEHVPVKSIVINQVLQSKTTSVFLENRRKDQQKSLRLLMEDPGLKELQVIYGPLVDLEVRGVPALHYFGSQVWK